MQKRGRKSSETGPPPRLDPSLAFLLEEEAARPDSPKFKDTCANTFKAHQFTCYISLVYLGQRQTFKKTAICGFRVSYALELFNKGVCAASPLVARQP